MEPEQVLKKLTEKGVMVTPDMMKRIRSGELGISDQVAPSDVGERRRPKTGLVVKTSSVSRKDRLSTQDFIKYYNNRFDGLRSIILKKMGAVSINKLSDGHSLVSVIGMVRERLPHGFVLEDATGEVEVVCNLPVQADDVVGVKGEIREGKLLMSELVWPDVPLRNSASFVDRLILLLTTGAEENVRKMMNGFSIVLYPGGDTTRFTNEEKKRTITNHPVPSHITITKDGNEFRILIYKPGEKATKDDAISYLRKRHLSPDKKRIFSTTDPFLIDPIPDLLWLVGGTRDIMRYKGVTIIITEDGDTLRYDAGTGQAHFTHESVIPTGTPSSEDEHPEGTNTMRGTGAQAGRKA